MRSMEGLPTYTAAEVSKHASAHDAWIIINGKVLDITPWLEEHPGGDDVLLAAAGTFSFSPLLLSVTCVRTLCSALRDTFGLVFCHPLPGVLYRIIPI